MTLKELNEKAKELGLDENVALALVGEYCSGEIDDVSFGQYDYNSKECLVLYLAEA